MSRIAFFFCLVFCLIFSFCALSLDGKIVQIDDIRLFEQEAGELNADTLVLFDVDQTLIMMQDAILWPHAKELSQKIMSEIHENPDLVSLGDKYPEGVLLSRVLSTTKWVTVDPQSVAIVQKLQKKGIPVLALTAAEGKKVGEIENFADFRIDQLKKLGFDFSGTLPTKEFVQFSDSDGPEFHPLFKSGVLFSSKHPKGDVLKAFLGEFRLSPKKVVFIDDRMEYIQSVENAMRGQGIECIGLHYIAVEKLSCPLNEKVARFQFHHLIEHGEWLSDEQAHSRMHLQKSPS